MIFNLFEVIVINSTKDYVLSLGVFIFLFALFKLFDGSLIYFFKKYAKKSKNNIDDFVVSFFEKVSWFFYLFLALYFATLFIKIPSKIEKFLGVLLISFILYYVCRGISNIINQIIDIQINKNKKEKGVENSSIIKLFGSIGKVIIYLVALLMFLSNLGIEITPLIASLGVAGIAIALALQNVLGDLFSAFSIFFDKPFTEGDFIIIGNDMGVIHKIGMKSTRITTLQGQELIVPNTEMTNIRINNFGKMQKRRVVFGFGVEYDTPTKKLEKVKKIVQKIIKETKKAELDRVHFKNFGDSALNFEVVYYIATADYNEYMDTQEEINLKLKKEFEKQGIVFAFPTQTIHLKKE
jgi:small-conductance mechanosensitive channel